MEICLFIRLKSVITPIDVLSNLQKRVVARVHKAVAVLVVLMVQTRWLCGLKEETKSHMLEFKVPR
jgi:type III secretory pathway component EscS